MADVEIDAEVIESIATIKTNICWIKKALNSISKDNRDFKRDVWKRIDCLENQASSSKWIIRIGGLLITALVLGVGAKLLELI